MKDLSIAAEREVIIDCQQGKKESYRFLVEKYKVQAYQLALLYTGNRDDALDLSQEAFCRAFRSIRSFQPGKNFYTWLYKIIKNICINHHYRRRRIQPLSAAADQDLLEEQVSPLPNPDEIFEAHELREQVWAAINQLKPQDQEIIIMKEFNDLSYDEIAAILTIPPGSVMSRLYYARQRLAKILGREYE
jgi:RNA polymerase sigma-70 factor, ECF subfamily